MANKKSSKKNIQTIKKQTERNKSVNSKIKTLSKKLKLNQDSEIARQLISISDKACKNNIIHKNKANKIKSKNSKTAFSAI